MSSNSRVRRLHLGAIILGLSVACGSEGDADTGDAGATGTDGGTTASANTESTSAGPTSGGSGSASGSATSATSGSTEGTDADTTTTPGDTTAEGSGSTAAEASTGLPGDCTSFESSAECEAADCLWIGDENTGGCVPDLEPTGGDVCEPLMMLQCEVFPQCTWDAATSTCNPA